MGGNPFGCPKGSDTKPPGSQCGRDTPKGWIPRAISSFSSSALEIDFPQAANTDWQLGSTQVKHNTHWPIHLRLFQKGPLFF